MKHRIYDCHAAPIALSATMAQALQRGEKTQVRLPVDPQPRGHCLDSFLNGAWLARPFGGLIMPRIRDLPRECPHGKPGTYLFVQEPFVGWWDTSSNELGRVAEYMADGYMAKPGERVAEPKEMPRWASRMALMITDVQVQRLHDMALEDALAEGYRSVMRSHADKTIDTIDRFATDWDAQYPELPWLTNPWAYILSVVLVPKE